MIQLPEFNVMHSQSPDEMAPIAEHNQYDTHYFEQKMLNGLKFCQQQKHQENSSIPESFENIFSQNTVPEIQEWIKGGNDLDFTFEGQVYSLSYNANRDKYQVFNEHGCSVDRRAEFDSDRTVEGFIEISGLEGLDRRERLYIGVDPENNLVMIQAPAKLKGKFCDRDQQETLLTQGIYHYSTPLEQEPPQPSIPDDGIDLYVFDENGPHHDLVLDTAKHFAGEDIQINSVKIIPSTFPQSLEAVPPLSDSRQSVAELAKGVEELVKLNFPDWQNNPSVANVVNGLNQTAEDFSQGTETLGDYFFIKDTLTFLRLSGAASIQEQSLALNQEANFSLNMHRENYPSSDPLIAAANEGKLNLKDSSVRFYLFGLTSETPGHTLGYNETLLSLYNLSGQLSALTVDQSADLFFSQPLIGAENLGVEILQNGLLASGLADEQGNLIPVPGFDEQSQPVRVINISIGTSVNDLIPEIPMFDLLDIFPPASDSAFTQSLSEYLPDNLKQQLTDGEITLGDASRVGVANAVVAKMNDPQSEIYQSLSQINSLTHESVQELLDANILVVMSAGNEANDYIGTVAGASKNILATDNMIVVGASDDNNTPEIEDDTLADFSSSGADFVVDGVDVPSSNGESMTGTSFSAPTFSAWLSVALDENPQLSAHDVMNMLNDPTLVGTLYHDIPDTREDGLGILIEEMLSDVFSNYDSSEYIS